MSKIFNRSIKLCGELQKVGTPAITVLEYDIDSQVMGAKGSVVPTDGDAGYAKGCRFVKTDGTVATTLYINEGSATVADFNAMETSASTITGVTAGAGLTGGGTEGTVTLDVVNTDGKITVGANTIDITAASLVRADISAPAGSKSSQVIGGTIATTGATTEHLIAPEAGSLSSIEINPLVALTADNTNYITFSVVNLGQDGNGTTAMLADDDANTTKATGGTGLAIHTKRALTVHGTAANKVVAQGDKIRIIATATGTLANTVTIPIYMLRFGGTT